MIASALRAEIQRFHSKAHPHLDPEVLARCAIAVHRVTRGMRAACAEEVLPSVRAISILVERVVADQPAVHLAYRALAESLLAELGLPGADRDRLEAAFDAIDDIVQEPAELLPLREHLRIFCAHFERACQEATLVPRRHPDLRVSAA